MSLALLEPETTAIAEPPDAKWAPPVSYYDPAFKKEVVAQIKALRKLPAGWDGYHAPKISPAIVQAAITFVNALPDQIAPRPRIVPLISGALQFEWDAGPRSLEFEFEDEETIHYLKWDPPTKTEEEDSFDVSDVGRAESLIRWFSSPHVS